MNQVRETTHFGFQQVPPGEKQSLIDAVFRNVANRYDLMNDLMSGGLHRAWKDVLVNAVNPPKGDGSHLRCSISRGHWRHRCSCRGRGGPRHPGHRA